MAREINLVPDIKGEMIKTLKLRNFIFFLCIVVASASVAVTVMAGLVMGGQQAAVNGKRDMINKMSAKLNSYTDLNDFLTFKDQLGNISQLTSNKKVLSRTFNVLSALVPTGPDMIKLSELSVDFSGEAPVFRLEAQADALKEPYIDYNVLESFKKSMEFMTYDYGNYVDKDNNSIPAYCMIEFGEDGALLKEPERGIYAYWRIKAKGCNPSAKSTSSTEESEKDESAESADSTESSETVDPSVSKYTLEQYQGEDVVRIWRTPQLQSWYKENPKEGEPYMDANGNIANIEHFNSACYSYSVDKTQGDSSMKLVEKNDSCKLVTEIKVPEHSNGRGAEDHLVLRFTASITLTPEVFNFNNHHMMSIPPSGHHNVTDSYVQIQAMFGERATDCAAGDDACKNNKTNENGNENGGNNNG